MRILLLAAIPFITTPLFAQMEYDARILEYTGLKYPCPGGVTPILKIINEGSATMSSCVVQTWTNGLLTGSFDWQLAVPAAQGDVRQPLLPELPDVDPGDALEFRIISVNGVPDQVSDGNILEVMLDGFHATTSTPDVTVKIETDETPSDLTWEIRNDLNQLVASGGPYEIPDAVIIEPVTLDPTSCYTFKALDNSRDVLSDARVQVLGGPNTLLSVQGPGLLAGDRLGLSTGNGEACDHPLIMELHTDAAPEETSWEIVDQSNGAIVCSGTGYQQADAYVTANCCLPDGCYRLRVLDSGSDGMTTGGYVLRNAGSNLRMIDNMDNFNGVFDGDLSAISGDQGFCLPIGDDTPIYSSCDKLDWVSNKFIVCNEDPQVSAGYSATYNLSNFSHGYIWWFYDPNGSYSFRRYRNHATSDGYGSGATRACHFRLNAWANTPSSPHLPEGVLLNVRVRARVNDVNQEWGPACQFKMDAARAACPLVNLQDNPSLNEFSCGVNRMFGGPNSWMNRLTASQPQPVPAVSSGSVRYQFRFRIPGEGVCIVRPAQTSARIFLNWSAASGPQLECNKQYEVDVRVSLDGGATWCVDAPSPACDPDPVTPWGKVCVVNITDSPDCPIEFSGPMDELSPSAAGQLTLYPNPIQGDHVFLHLIGIEPAVDRAYAEVFDSVGKQVVAGSVGLSDGSLNTTVGLPSTMTNGLYLMRLRVGEQEFTERLVLQR